MSIYYFTASNFYNPRGFTNLHHFNCLLVLESCQCFHLMSKFHFELFNSCFFPLVPLNVCIWNFPTNVPKQICVPSKPLTTYRNKSSKQMLSPVWSLGELSMSVQKQQHSFKIDEAPLLGQSCKKHIFYSISLNLASIFLSG